MKKLILAITSVLIISLVIRLWTGAYYHDEFAENHFFIKHRPTWKWTFYSPIGMTDNQLNDLTEEQRVEQLLFEEYISSRGMSK